MKFSVLENLMISRGISSLSGIARFLDTTPQAVSNWKARDQVPHHITAKINHLNQDTQNIDSPSIVFNKQAFEEDKVSFPDIFVIIAEQLKVLLLIPFVAVFLTFTYVQFIQIPKYVSWATVLVPENQPNSMGGLGGIAAQFGVNIPTRSQADLSSPALLPELLFSRTFAEKLLYKEFYTKKLKGSAPLISILNDGKSNITDNDEAQIASAIRKFRDMLDFQQTLDDPVSTLRVTTNEAEFSKKLADRILVQLDSLNRYYKNQVANEKINFIEERIFSVVKDLRTSEQALKTFNQQNRQISSPSLQLQLDRLEREVEIQKGIYLTLKQQLELAKIERIQEASIIQIIDMPQISISPVDKNLILKLFLSAVLSLSLAFIIGLIRSKTINANINDRKKIRRIKFLVKKKSFDLFKDPHVSAIISVVLCCGLPFFLGHQSKHPKFFSMYSTTAMLINSVYILVLLISVFLFFYQRKQVRKNDIIIKEK